MPLDQIENKILLILAVLYLWLTYSPCIPGVSPKCGTEARRRTTSLAHALMTCRLRPGREHAPNKQYALNSGVHLITRVYGILLLGSNRISVIGLFCA